MVGVSYDVELDGIPLIIQTDQNGKQAIEIGEATREPGQRGEIGTIAISSLHHGYGQKLAVDDRRVYSVSYADLSIPGHIFPAGALGLLYTSGAADFFSNQGGGSITIPRLGNPLFPPKIYFITAKAIRSIIAVNESYTGVSNTFDATHMYWTGVRAPDNYYVGCKITVYGGYYATITGSTAGVSITVGSWVGGTPAGSNLPFTITEGDPVEEKLAESTNAFTGQAARYGNLLFFGREDASYKSLTPAKLTIDTNTWSWGGLPMSYLYTQKNTIWWVENDGYRGTPQIWSTDDPSFGSSTQTSISISQNSDDGTVRRFGAGYPPTSLTVFPNNLDVGQYTTGGNYYLDRGYIRFNLNALPAERSDLSAFLRLVAKTNDSPQDFTMRVKLGAWGPTLETTDWGAADLGPELGSWSSADYPGDGQPVDIVLDITKLPTTGWCELVLISDREEQGYPPDADDERVTFYDKNDGSNEAKIYVTYVDSIVAGPFPLEAGGYCTWLQTIGPWVLAYKADGLIYGMDEYGNPTPLTVREEGGQADFRFGHGSKADWRGRVNIRSRTNLIALNFPSLATEDINPINTSLYGPDVYTKFIGAIAPLGSRQFIVLDAGSVAADSILCASRSYPDGDYPAPVGSFPSSYGVCEALEPIQLSTGNYALYSLHNSSTGEARISRTDVASSGWVVAPLGLSTTNNLKTAYYGGSGLAANVTKRLLQVRGVVNVGSPNSTLGFSTDLSLSWASLATLSASGHFSIPFPSTSACLGRSVSLSISPNAGNFILPILIDYEAILSVEDMITIGLDVSDTTINKLGFMWKRRGVVDLRETLKAMRNTIKTLKFTNRDPWTVEVVNVTDRSVRQGAPLYPQKDLIYIVCKRLA